MVRSIIKFFIVYVLYIAVLAFLQRSLIYFPNTNRPEQVSGAEIVDVVTEDGISLQAWYFQAQDSLKPTIVFFHGNAGHYGYGFFKAQHYLNEGYGVLLAEYRGYGGNEGRPSEVGFYKDGRAYINWLINEKGISENELVILGESIGSGTAGQPPFLGPVTCS